MKQHNLIKNYIEGLTSGYSNSLIVVSPAGYGKTELVLNTMKEMNYKENTHYKYITNYITPVELYKTLETMSELAQPQILVLDDVEHILADPKIVGILKSALWQMPNGKRKVCWISGTHQIDKKEFEFNGKIIFLLNNFKKEVPIVGALKDRGFYYEMKMSNQEIVELLEKRVEKPYFNLSYKNRKKILDFIKQNITKQTNLSLRILPKAFQTYLISPVNWREMTIEMLK